MRPQLSALIFAAATIGEPTGQLVGEELRKAIVSLVPGDARPLKVVATELSADGAAATVTFQSELGIFAFQLHPQAEALTKLTLVIQGQQFCEGLTFWPPAGDPVDLLQTSGVTIEKKPRDLAITISGAAIAALRPGGKIQFINQYR